MPVYPIPWRTWLDLTPDVCEHFQTGGGKPPVFPLYCSTPITRLLFPSNLLYFCSAPAVPLAVPLRPGVPPTVGLPCRMTIHLISLLPETPAGTVPSTLFRQISGRPYLWEFVVYSHSEERRPSPTSPLSEPFLNQSGHCPPPAISFFSSSTTPTSVSRFLRHNPILVV